MAHGTLSGYRKGCRCYECFDANRKYEKRLRYDISIGRERLVDAADAKEHIHELMRHGMPIHAISRAMGYRDTNAIRGLLKRSRIRRETHERIMAIRMNRSDAPETAWVPAIGTARRIRALAVRGWPSVEVSRRTGLDTTTVSDIIRGRVDQVRTSTARAVAGLYAEISDEYGGSIRSVNRARARKWAPPAAWDNIDDPFETPKR